MQLLGAKIVICVNFSWLFMGRGVSDSEMHVSMIIKKESKKKQ